MDVEWWYQLPEAFQNSDNYLPQWHTGHHSHYQNMHWSFSRTNKRCSKMLPQLIHTACVSKRYTTCVTSPSLLSVFSACLPVTHEQECTPLRVISYVMMTNSYSCQKWDNIRNGVRMFESTIRTSCMQTPLCWQPHLAMEVCEGEQPLYVKI